MRDGNTYFVSENTYRAIGSGVEISRIAFESGVDHGRWAQWDGIDASMNFDGQNAVFATRRFDNISAVGFIIDKDSFSSVRFWPQWEGFTALLSRNGPVKQPPQPLASSSHTGPAYPPHLVTFDGAGSTDPDGTISFLRWTFDNGDSIAGPVATGTFTTAGVYRPVLTVYDNDLIRRDDDRLVIEVLAPAVSNPAATVASWGGDMVSSSVQFRNDGQTQTTHIPAGSEWWANTSYSALRRGALSRGASISYDFCYTAWLGQLVPASVSYRGQTLAVPAQYVGRPLNEVVSEAILANAESLMASGGSGWPGSDKYGNNWYAVRYAGAGIGFLATDHAFDPARRIVIGEIANQPPVALFTANPNFGDAPLLVTFNAAASHDSDGSLANYSWNFGNGSTGSGISRTETFHLPGIYEVILTVTDDRGATATRSAWITVTDPSAGAQAITFISQPQGGTVAAGQSLPLPGWSGPWSGGSTNRPLSIFGSLDYADAFGNELVATGGRIRQNTTNSNSPTRAFDTTTGGPLASLVSGGKIRHGRVFFSHLFRWERTTSFSFGLRDGSSHSARLFMDTADGNAWKVAVGSEVRGLPVPLQSHTVHLLVWEIDYDSSVTRLYLNPTLGQDSPPPAVEIALALPVTNFFGNGNREYDWDELRLGTSLAAVTPHLTPAQPTIANWTPPPPASTGTFWVRVRNPLVAVASSAAVVTVEGSSSYAQWAAPLPESARSPHADHLYSGMPNALRFALGLAPDERPRAEHQPLPVADGDNLRITWPLRAGVGFVVEASLNLGNWSPLTVLMPQAQVEQLPAGDGMTTVSATFPHGGPIFVRLAVDATASP